MCPHVSSLYHAHSFADGSVCSRYMLYPLRVTPKVDTGVRTSGQVVKMACGPGSVVGKGGRDRDGARKNT